MRVYDLTVEFKTSSLCLHVTTVLDEYATLRTRTVRTTSVVYVLFLKFTIHVYCLCIDVLHLFAIRIFLVHIRMDQAADTTTFQLLHFCFRYWLKWFMNRIRDKLWEDIVMESCRRGDRRQKTHSLYRFAIVLRRCLCLYMSIVCGNSSTIPSNDDRVVCVPHTIRGACNAYYCCDYGRCDLSSSSGTSPFIFVSTAITLRMVRHCALSSMAHHLAINHRTECASTVCSEVCAVRTWTFRIFLSVGFPFCMLTVDIDNIFSTTVFFSLFKLLGIT